MTYTVRRSNSIPRRRLQSTVLALAIVLLEALLATPTAQGQTLTVLHSFKGGGDGTNPLAGLIRDGKGSLYGTSQLGGAFNYGTVFKLDATGKYTLLYSFTGGADGGYPFGGVIRDAGGNLYGTSLAGGSVRACNNGFGCGTVFKLDRRGIETVLYNFTGATDGASPQASLIQDANGNLYGTTATGGVGCGSLGCGTVFKLDPTGTESVLYSFTGAADGRSPYGGLVRDAKGNIYGTTYTGGDLNCFSLGCGTLFKLDAAGTEIVLHSFTDGADGGYPFDALVPNGENLFGTTQTGGAFGHGTVFRLDKTGKQSVLYSFAGSPDGASPVAALIHDAAGTLYGTTQNGGAFNDGTVFKLDTTGEETVLHSFTGAADGKSPDAALIRDAGGNLYGTTYGGGAFGFGTVFKIAP